MERELPKVSILIYLDDPTDDDPPRIQSALERAAAARPWLTESPEFVDVTEDAGATRPEDVPIRTVGVSLDVTDTRDRSMPLDLKRDGIELQDFEALLAIVTDYSKEHSKTWTLLYDGCHVGSIENGVIDQYVADGLLKPWRAVVNGTLRL